MTTGPNAGSRLRVLARLGAEHSDFARPAAADIFIEQGRTSHFTSFYSSGLLIHDPGDICLLTSNPGWRTSWSIIAPGNFSGGQFTDLLFYDQSAGLGEFYTTEGGNLSLLASDAGWRTSWSIIIPCNLTGGRYNDLLFYDAAGGTGEIYSTDGHGKLSLVMSNSGWRTSWSIIIPCNLTGGRYNDLLFYDAAGGTGEIYSTDGHGNLSLVMSNSGWRTSWSVIAACDITGGRYNDLLFYDAGGGTGEIYSTDGHGNLNLKASHTDWQTSWSIVKPCSISGGKSNDLMFYDPGAGVGEFYSTDSDGNISLLHNAANWRPSWTIIAPANFTRGAGQDLLFYDRAGGTGEIYTTRGNTLATAVLATCEADYEALRHYFGGITPSGLPFNIDVRSGNGGASHNGCGDTTLVCDAHAGDDPDLVRYLVVSEADEVFMDNQGAGWDCGASNGEGLSRVLATHRYPQPGAPFGFATGPSWLSSDRPDWVSSTDGSDQHFVSIGCATLFIHYLKFQLGYSFEEITLIGGSNLADTYLGLTGRIDAFAPFKALLDRRFAAGTAAPLSTDNPFPAHPDLLFYDASAATGEFYSTDITGGISLLSSNTGWRGSWSLILPGNFSGRSVNDLLFYDPSAGTGEFYSTDGDGGITLLNTNTGWRTSWNMIISARFGASKFDALLFYDRAGGTGEIYTTDGHGRIAELVASHTDWRTSWTVILAGCFTRNESPDLLFYDASAGLVEIYTTDVDGGISLVGSTANLPQDWTLGITCNVTGGQFMDLMFYRPAAGEVQFFTTDGEGGLQPLSTQSVGGNWSQIHATALGEFLFYDASQGAGEYRRTTQTGAMTLLNRHNDWRQSWSLIAPGVYRSASSTAV
jgi:hypothetical protein